MKNISIKVILLTIVFVLTTLLFRGVLEIVLHTGCGFWSCLFDPTPHALVDRITLIVGLLFASIVIVYVINFQSQVVRVQQDNAQRYQRLYEQASMGYLTLTMEGRIQDMNQAWLDITGYEQANLLNRPFLELVTPAEQDAFQQQFALLKKQGWWQDIELGIKRKNGETATVRLNGELAVNEQKKAIIQCTIQDISRYKRTENTLARIGRQSRLLLEAAGDGICGLDIDGKIIFVNPAAEQLLGYSAAELMWHTFHERVYHSYPDGRTFPIEDNPITQTLQTGEQHFNDHAYFWHKNGSLIPIQFISTSVQEEDRIAGAVITFRDITDRLRQEEALQESEARYRSLFYNNASMIVLLDPASGQIIDANQAACVFYGYELAELVGLRIYDLSIQTSSHAARLLEKTLINPGARIESRHRLANDTIRDVEIYSGTVEIGGKQLLYGIIHDITERKEAEAAHRLDEARLEALLELSQMTLSTSEHIANFVIDRGINLTDSTAGVICLYRPDKTMTVTIHYASGQTKNLNLDPEQPGDEDQLVIRWLMALQQDHHVPFISNKFLPMTVLPTAVQAEIPVVERYMGIPVVENGLITMFAAVANKTAAYNDADLRQLHLLVDSMWKLMQQQQAQRKTIALTLEQERRIILSDFIEAASHEFRNPLSVINSATYMIRRLTKDDTLNAQLDKLQKQSDYISHLVDRMLVLVGLDKAPDARPTGFNINNIMESIESDHRYDFTAAGLTLVLDLDPTVPEYFGYNQFLHLALIEIVYNAELYTPAGGTVTLTTGHTPDWIIVTVADTGIGISAEDLPRIFENFYRADKARTERHAGMGLTIARRIIEFHHGSVTVESTVGEGSTFTIKLPR